MTFDEVVLLAGRVTEGAGVAIIVCGLLVASLSAAVALRRDDAKAVYGSYRRRLGKAILLGLEFLVAGDIIRTVAVDPTFHRVGVLAAIVAVRTFLSFSLELELEGRWPWDRARRDVGT